jgi:gliding motility-associated-like protein
MIARYFFIAILLLVSLFTNGQLCQGSLGDPLVNITFGSGGNPGAPLSAAATGYQFVSSDCPNDGFYTVRNNTNSCFGNTWHSLTTDHTGNGSGYFMLVNASIQPSAFYVDTVRGLCGSSTYEFAAWIANVILSNSCNGNSNQPNLTFRIEQTDGTLLQTYNSGNIPTTGSIQWKQYGFFFTTPPAGSDIVLRIVNNAPGGCGNDLALDDITFRPCGPQITPSITGQASRTVNICQGTAASFQLTSAISGGFTSPVFQWQHRLNNAPWTDIPGANSTTFPTAFTAANPAGTYEYRLSVAEAGNLGSAQCRISSVPLTVIINPLPIATAVNNGPACEGSDITLTATGGTQYLWTGPNNYSANAATVTLPAIAPGASGNYSVTATSPAGCSSTASTSVQVNPAPVAAVSFADTSVCINGKVQFMASGGNDFFWTPAAGLSATNIANPIATPSMDTRYTVKVTGSNQCSDTTSINVRVNPVAIANAGPDRVIIAGGTALLAGSITGTYQSFNWFPATNLNDPMLLQPVSTASADAQYILSVVSKNNCGTSSDTVLIKIYKGIFIPNAFSPNGDGLNDTWNIPALAAYPDFELFVFNRYGEVVYRNSKSHEPWDGKFKGSPLPIGAYPYLIKLNVANQQFKGMLMLIH